MAQYRVLQTSFINNKLVDEGETIEFDGEPGPNLEVVKTKRGSKNDAPDVANPEPTT